MKGFIDDRREPELHVGAALNALEMAEAAVHEFLALALGGDCPSAKVETGARAAHHVYKARWQAERVFELVRMPSTSKEAAISTIALLQEARAHLDKLCGCFPSIELARDGGRDYLPEWSIAEYANAWRRAQDALEKTDAALSTLGQMQQITRMLPPENGDLQNPQ
jgi:hypothetical protein